MLPDLIVLVGPGLDSGCCCGRCRGLGGGGGDAGGARGHDGAGAPGEVVLTTDPPQGFKKNNKKFVIKWFDSAVIRGKHKTVKIMEPHTIISRFHDYTVPRLWLITMDLLRKQQSNVVAGFPAKNKLGISRICNSGTKIIGAVV